MIHSTRSTRGADGMGFDVSWGFLQNQAHTLSVAGIWVHMLHHRCRLRQIELPTAAATAEKRLMNEKQQLAACFQTCACQSRPYFPTIHASISTFSPIHLRIVSGAGASGQED